MKVAICLQGLSVGKSDVAARGHNKIVEGAFPVAVDTSIMSAVAADRDIDFFIHTWGTESEKALCDFYKPKKALFEEPIIFAPEGDYSHSVKSRWYSHKKSIELAAEYEGECNFEYDWIFVSRFDVRYFNRFELEKLDNQFFYVSHWVGNAEEDGLLDYWFLGNSSTMKKFACVFDDIDSYLSQDDYPSSHWISMRHLKNQGDWDKVKHYKHEKIDFDLTRRVMGWSQT